MAHVSYYSLSSKPLEAQAAHQAGKEAIHSAPRYVSPLRDVVSDGVERDDGCVGSKAGQRECVDFLHAHKLIACIFRPPRQVRPAR